MTLLKYINRRTWLAVLAFVLILAAAPLISNHFRGDGTESVVTPEQRKLIDSKTVELLTDLFYQQISDQIIVLEHDRGEIELNHAELGVSVTEETISHIAEAGFLVRILLLENTYYYRDVGYHVDRDLAEHIVREKLNSAAEEQITTEYTSGSDPHIKEGKEGREVSNIDELVEEVITALVNGQSYAGKVEFRPVLFEKRVETIDDSRVYTYSITSWGAVRGGMAEFAKQVRETLRHNEGWGKAGIVFRQVDSGGDFTVVLSEPARVGGASSGCSVLWSCRVGRHVIINDDRWMGASGAWNSAGGSLRDYRHMVINHEVGHWLGLGHLKCPGAGQLAPVMQQQSIDLQGCNFNPWPSDLEAKAIR